MSFWDSLMDPARPDARLMFLDERGSHRTTWGGLVNQATRSAAGLRRLGVGPGTAVACPGCGSRMVVPGLPVARLLTEPDAAPYAEPQPEPSPMRSWLVSDAPASGSQASSSTSSPT